MFKRFIQPLINRGAAAVLAHEIAHAKLRHPAASLGRGIAAGLTLSLLSTGLGETIAGNAMSATSKPKPSNNRVDNRRFNFSIKTEGYE